ncbi:MAG: CCA tRNA nucleotidyltransferase [Pseudomonadota bacterium]
MKISAPWLTDPATVAVLSALGGEVLFVGGCVRNAVLQAPVSDIDLSTPVLPQEVIARAERAGLQAVPTGIDHGTVTLIARGQPFEVTTFRADVETDGRRAVVRFSTDIAEDARRRDFTMNALYADAEGRVIDPLDGLADMLARRVRFILTPEDRIREDALRILRFFRFNAWYGSDIDPEGLAACAGLAEKVDDLARERIGAEMRKLLAAPDPAPATASMAAAGVLARCLPGADPAGLAPLVAREEATGAHIAWLTRLASLGGVEVAARLRLSRQEERGLDALITARDSPYGPAALAAAYGGEAATGAMLLRTSLVPADWPTVMAEIERGRGREMPLQAGDLMRIAALSGPSLGAALTRAKRAWFASDLRLDKAGLMEEALKGHHN